MGNFKVDPAKVRDAANQLKTKVAPAYASSADKLHSDGSIGWPGFGVALSLLEAAYTQRLDFMVLDVRGAHDVTNEIADRLKLTTTEYEKGENLNIKGFDGKGSTPESYGAAFGGALVNSVPTAAVTGAIEVGIILATVGTLEGVGALAPSFIPAAIAIPLFACNLPGMFTAGVGLINESGHLKDPVNTAFSDMCGVAKDGWEGQGATNFSLLATKVKAHMDKMADYIATVGEALLALASALTVLWLGLIAMAVPLLVWLIAMRIAEAAPPWVQAAGIETVIETTMAIIDSAVLAKLLGITTVGALIMALLGAIGNQIVGALAMPDGGKGGVPDMQEFHVDQNYSTPL